MNHFSKSLAKQPHRTKIQHGGRVVIPAELRKMLDLAIGDDLIVKVEDGEIRLYSTAQALKRAQAMVAKYDKRKDKSESVVDALIAERRREAKREQLEFG